jgi:thiamine-phosphate pyrophosphorylase
MNIFSGAGVRGLYPVTPEWDDTQKLLEVTEAGLRGGVVLAQYRHKAASAQLRRTRAAQLQALCRTYRRPFIISGGARSYCAVS